MMGFSSCNNSDIFQWLKLVSIDGICIEPFSHLQHFHSIVLPPYGHQYGSIPISKSTSEHVGPSKVADVKYHWHLDWRYEYNHPKSLYLAWKDNHWATQCASSTMIWFILLTNFSFFQSHLKRFPLTKSSLGIMNWYFSASISYKRMSIYLTEIMLQHTLIRSLL